MTAIADVDGDRRLDLVDVASTNAFVRRGCGDGTFEMTAIASNGALTVPTFPSLPPVSFTGVAVADFNGDGLADIAMAGSMDKIQYLAIAAGRPDGTFVAPLGSGGFSLGTMANVTSNLVFIGDMNGDGVTDLLLQIGWYDPMLNRCIKLVSAIGRRGGTNFDTSSSVNPDTDCPARKGSAGRASVGKILGNGHFNASFGEVYQSFTGTPMPRFTIFDGSGDGTFVATPTGVGPVNVPALAGYLSVTWRDLDGDGRDDAIATADGTHPTQISGTMVG